MINNLRPYQSDVFRAITSSIADEEGLTFSVEIARQGAKNELSAQIELCLLTAQTRVPRNLVKCSPTFVPQSLISMTRLKDRLDDAGFAGLWTPERGYMVRVGRTRAVFLSAEESSRVVGHTAHILLELDEAQDVPHDKYSKDFRPMAATTNATTVLYGTAWDESTLLEQVKQINLELERKDGVKRHFSFDWQEVARYNPAYLKYVEGERERLGDDHPLFRTQYRLLPISGGGGFLSALQRSQLQGTHARLRCPIPGRVYVAAIDLGGEVEEDEGSFKVSLVRRQDSTVVTIGEIESAPHSSRSSLSLDESRLQDCPMPHERSESALLYPGQPVIRIVEHYSWNGVRHSDLYPQLVDILKNVWHCRRIVVDSTGIGQPVYSFLRSSLGSRVSPFVFTAPSKSELAFNLLASINSGRIKMYSPDGSSEHREFWVQMEKAKSHYRPSRTMNFYVDPSKGHDDYLMSLAMLVNAGAAPEPRVARGK